MSEHILIVDDEKEIADLLEVYLKNEGYQVHKFYHGKGALDCLKDTKIDLALLDIMLPDIDGFTLCRKIREKWFFPVIMLTAKSEDGDKIMGITLGADDYITKPFRIRELLSRMKSVLRRYRKTDGGEQTFRIRDITVCPMQAKVYKGEEELNLTAMEYRLLLTLVQAEGRVLSRNQLLESLWDIGGDYVNDNTLTVYIKRLREKLGGNGEAELIKTVRGLGYRLGE